MLDHFYRQQGSRMRASGDGQLWVARAPEIVAGLSLSCIEGGWWLTGLFVAPQRRGTGIARALIEAALCQPYGTAWLFCHPTLQPFYASVGFGPADHLPQALASRLQRYQRSKALVALQRRQYGDAVSVVEARQ
ncbi:GNAT family N-acetyltransferase [Pseudomonas sp. S60]|uniref:GNAT family N-acetyltransferase n=1 Tax=Pseudomonas sp. S60 TaxID=211124 RepID=UPI0022A7461C|nr:GNAT family N-acetyltransferase [Pseudomonas sp. S60]